MKHARRLETLVSVAVGIVAFLSVVPIAALDVTNVDWALQGDYAQHLIGWEFFCHEPWRLPLGATHRFVAPAQSTLLLTDAMPPVAVVLRALGACGLPSFQYIGPWLLVCFVLQSVCAGRLAAALGFDVSARVATSAICAFAPILVQRVGHATLCSQFFLLLALELVVRAPLTERRRLVTQLFAINGAAALLHPYVMAMVSPWSVVAAVRGKRTVGAGILAVALADAAGLWLTGTIAGHQPAAGFGAFASDTLGFFNSEGHGRLLTGTSGHRFEGYSYLGAGLIAALLIAAVARLQAARTRTTETAPFPAGVWWTATAAWLFSLSTKVTCLGSVVVDASVLNSWLGPIPSALRSSGRFSWPLWYVLAFTAIALLHRLARGRILLSMVAVAQLIDVVGVYEPYRGAPQGRLALADARWESALGDRHEVRFVPPLVLPAVDLMNAWPDPKLWIPFARFVAQRPPVSINSGYLARVPLAEVDAAFRLTLRELEQGKPRSDVLYVFAPSDRQPLNDGALCCARLQDATACVARSSAWSLPCEDPLP